MYNRVILILGLACLVGLQDAGAQSFKDGLKQFVKQVGKQIEKNETEQSGAGVTKAATAKTDVQANGEEPTVNLPEQHTALFAPLGYPINAEYGVLSVKPVMPPRDAPKQVDWVEKMPYLYNLDNRSLVDEFLLLDDCKADGYIEALTPADHRYHNVLDELWARAGALNKLVEAYNEAKSEYGSDSPQWVIDGWHDKIAAILDSREYKTIIRSSLVPLFTLKDKFIEDETKTYFQAHGGYENAVKAEWTKWDPHPVKKGVTTSVPGQTGKVLSEVQAGATVDVDGVEYVLHNSNNGSGGWAFASETVETAVSGKDMVIPGYIYYKGKSYPVRSMRGGIFSGRQIKSVTLPNTLTEISNSAFRDTPIKEIVIPASVKKLQGSAFLGCRNLTKVVFEGDSIDEIGGCFQNCTALTSIVLPRRIKETISYDMFNGCSSLTDVKLPENLKEIPKSMFEGCIKLKSIDIPASVVKVGSCAFSYCGVTSLDLSNVTEFDDFCFSDCKSLKTVKLNAKLKDDFISETYEHFMECPLLQVKYVDNKYVIPEGFIFVEGK